MSRREMIFLVLGLLIGVLIGLALAGNPPADPGPKADAKTPPNVEPLYEDVSA